MYCSALFRLYAVFFLMLRRPPTSTLFPYTTSSDLSSASRHRPPRRRAPDGVRAPPPCGWRGRARSRCRERRTPSGARSEEHTSELQSQFHLVCRLLLEKKTFLAKLISLFFQRSPLS